MTRMQSGTLMVSGSFANAEDISVLNIAGWDGREWQRPNSGTSGTDSGYMAAYSLSIAPQGDLIAAGHLSSLRGTPIHSIGRVGPGLNVTPLGEGVDVYSEQVAILADRSIAHEQTIRRWQLLSWRTSLGWRILEHLRQLSSDRNMSKSPSARLMAHCSREDLLHLEDRFSIRRQGGQEINGCLMARRLMD